MIETVDSNTNSASRYSLAFQFARNCLAGDRVWTGQVESLWGIYTRKFRISSGGVIQGKDLLFDERIDFADGESQNRSWRLLDTKDGVDLIADNAMPIRLGEIEKGKFEIEYRLKMSGIWFRYTDIFDVDDRGNVSNIGIIKIFGIPIMRVTAYSPGKAELTSGFEVNAAFS
ncbi:DUF3833 family protein [Hyphococcus lacteus]|uniref:DUF3833 family protein n=1 Tax=Hyphococcus lacteus TaxID=3143536 RepID=A0ABV3Z4B5_9PROT